MRLPVPVNAKAQITSISILIYAAAYNNVVSSPDGKQTMNAKDRYSNGTEGAPRPSTGIYLVIANAASAPLGLTVAGEVEGTKTHQVA